MKKLGLKFVFILVFICAGCELMVEHMDSQKGTWIGIAEPTMLYDINRAPHKVLMLKIQEGTKIGDGGLKGSLRFSDPEKSQFLFPTAVIVDKKFFAVDPKLYEGQQLKVQGILEVSYVTDPNDKSRLMWTTPKLNYEHMNPPGVIRVARIDVIDPQEIPKNQK